MAEQPYRRPPITEAVIEVRFATPLSPSDVDHVSRAYAAFYPLDLPIRNFDVAIGLPPGLTDIPTTKFNEQLGHRRANVEFSEILLVWPSTFVVSQLAPYPGWDTFFARFVRDWKAWRRRTDFRKVTQVGVRFINRIDIPIESGVIEEGEYLNVYPKIPTSFGTISGYGVQAQLPILDIGCTLVINSAVVPSPLLGHGSLLLDLDISKAADPPQTDDAIYELLNSIRVKKNDTFEACVTDRARELFRT